MFYTTPTQTTTSTSAPPSPTPMPGTPATFSNVRRISQNTQSPYGYAAVQKAGGNVRSERLLNSTVLREEYVHGYPPQDQVKYVEVPVVEEVIRTVPRKEYVEIEKKVPRYEFEWVERVVEIPQVQYVDKHVEVAKIQEVIRHVPVRQVVEVPREVIKYVPKVETKIVEREVEVPGEVIEIPRPYIVENKVIVPRFVDQEITCVVAQSLHPFITESETEFVDVELRDFTPYLVPVDVMVPRPVARQLLAHRKTEEHRIVDIPVGHFNAILKSVNPGLSDQDLEGKLISVHGMTPIATGVKFAALTSAAD